jgi:hypothetical protein
MINPDIDSIVVSARAGAVAGVISPYGEVANIDRLKPTYSRKLAPAGIFFKFSKR